MSGTGGTDDFDVSGLRVLVTGSTRGLGEGVATYLAGCGAAVAVHGRDEERLKAVHDGLAAEWGERGIRVNAILPGLMATESALESLFANDPAKIEEAARKIGVGRLGKPEDLGAACRYLLSPAAGFVHGSILVLDGGPVNVPTF